MVDVKLTETDLPWYFKLAQVPFINAHARVSIVQADTLQGALPVGVPDSRPEKVKVMFVDETTGATLAERELTRHRRRQRLCPLGQRQPSAAGQHRPRQDRRTGGDGRWQLR